MLKQGLLLTAGIVRSNAGLFSALQTSSRERLRVAYSLKYPPPISLTWSKLRKYNRQQSRSFQVVSGYNLFFFIAVVFELINGLIYSQPLALIKISELIIS